MVEAALVAVENEKETGGAVLVSLLQANARIEAQAVALRDAYTRIEGQEGTLRKFMHDCEVWQHRSEASDARLRIMTQELGRAREEVARRDATWARVRQNDGDVAAMAEGAREADEDAAAALAVSKAAVVAAEAETARAEADAREARALVAATRSKLAEAEERIRALETLAESRLSQTEALRMRIKQLEQDARVHRKEKYALLNEVDRNTSSSILRREELHFTRTQLLREQLRLKGEIEHRPLPPTLHPEKPDGSFTRPAPQGSVDGPGTFTSLTLERGVDGTRTPSPRSAPRSQRPSSASPRHARQQAAATAAAAGGACQGADSPYKQAPPSPGPRGMTRTAVPPTFVKGLAPRAPRCLDDEQSLEEQLGLEYRAATRKPRQPVRPASPPFRSPEGSPVASTTQLLDAIEPYNERRSWSDRRPPSPYRR